MNSLFSLSELGNREVEHGAGRDVGKSRVVKFEKIHSAKIENIKFPTRKAILISRFLYHTILSKTPRSGY